jgi:uncharacterized protein YbjT (DUF2867 family)
MSAKYLVVGGRGNIGSAVVGKLAQQGFSVRLATRDPGEAPLATNVSAVYFDYDDPGSWVASLSGISRVFMIPKVGDPFPEQTLMPFIDRARTAGINRIVFSTAMGLDKEWRVLAAAEDHLLNSGLDYTILRPGWFMQNFNPGFLLQAISSGMIALPGSESCRLSFIDARDIAEVAVAALVGDQLLGCICTLTGPQALTWAETVGQISSAWDLQVAYRQITQKQMRDALFAAGTSPYRVEQMLLMMRAMRDGIYAEVTHSITDVLGRPATSLQQFLAENRPAR